MEINKGGGGLQGYQKRKKAYQSKPENAKWILRRRRQATLIRLDGPDGAKSRASWRVKIRKKIKVLCKTSPKGILKMIKHVCLKMAGGFAGAMAAIGNGGGGTGGRENYDDMKMIEIYKSLAAQAGSGSFGGIAF